MGCSQIKGHLTSRIGRKVRFSAPKDVEQKGGNPGYGIIVDEVWADPDINVSPPRIPQSAEDWGDYSFCAQLIKWAEDEYSIRLAYYRRRAGEDHWEYASQTTVNSEWHTIKKLLEATLAKRHWYRDDPGY